MLWNKHSVWFQGEYYLNIFIENFWKMRLFADIWGWSAWKTSTYEALFFLLHCIVSSHRKTSPSPSRFSYSNNLAPLYPLNPLSQLVMLIHQKHLTCWQMPPWCQIWGNFFRFHIIKYYEDLPFLIALLWSPWPNGLTCFNITTVPLEHEMPRERSDFPWSHGQKVTWGALFRATHVMGPSVSTWPVCCFICKMRE